MGHELVAHGGSQLRGGEALLLHGHVLTVLQGADDGGVGAGPADALLLQRLDESGLGVARRRQGELLFVRQVEQRQRLTDGELGQLGGTVLLRLGVGVRGLQALRLQIAGEKQPLALGAPKGLAVLRRHRGVVELGGRHLRGHEAPPDELVELELVGGQKLLHAFGRQGHIDGAAGLVGVLRALLGLEHARLGRGVVRAVGRDDEVVRGLPGLVGDTHGVGTHVGDERHGAAIAQLHAFIDFLRRAHGLLGRVAQSPVGHLLQGGGGERRGRAFAALLLVHGLDREFPGAHGLVQRVGGRRVANVLQAGLHGLAGDLPELGDEGGRIPALQLGLEGPVLDGIEGPALALAVHDEPQLHGLHAAGGNAALHVLPEDGRNFVADEPVEHAARLLRTHEIGVDGPGVLQGLMHRAGGDLVELNAADVLVLALDELGHVPANGLPLAIRVRGEVDAIGGLGGLAQPADDVLLALDDLVARFVAVLLVQAHVALGQVAHVAHGGFHGVILAQELADGLHLGGRLNDDEVFWHDGAGYSHPRRGWQGAARRECCGGGTRRPSGIGKLMVAEKTIGKGELRLCMLCPFPQSIDFNKAP